MGTERLLKMSDLSRFQEYLKLADQLASHASKEDLAECARLLAFNVAHYEAKYGQLPLDETLELAYADTPNEAQLQLMSSGLEIMVGLLGGIVQGFDTKEMH